MDDPYLHRFCPIASELLDWLFICSGDGFICSLSSVEVVQELRIVSGEFFIDLVVFNQE